MRPTRKNEGYGIFARSLFFGDSMKKSFLQSNYNALFLFLMAALLALVFFNSPGTVDVELWLRWTRTIDEIGIINTYTFNEEFYPPLSYIILWFVSKASLLFNVNHFTALKGSLYLFLLLTSLSFYCYTRNILITTMLLLSLTLNTMALGYIDIYFAPCLVASLLALEKKKLVLFTILFTTSFLIKWQPIIIIPFLVIHLLNINTLKDISNIQIKELLLKVLLPFASLLILMLIIFGMAFPNSLLHGAMEGYLSGYALNFNWIYTFALRVLNPSNFGPLTEAGFVRLIRAPSFAVSLMPKLLFLISYTVIFIRFFTSKRSFNNLIGYSLLGYLSYFTFYTGVHENHLFMPCILVAILFYLNTEYILFFFSWSLAANINLFIFFGIEGKGLPFNRVVGGIDTTVLLALINLFLFIAFFIRIFAVKESQQE